MNDGTGLEDHPDSSQAAHGRRETPAEQSFSGLPTTVHISADHAGRWLAVSMAALAVLAAASAVVSYAAQYRMVEAAKKFAPVAALEAGIPDGAALIFATLGIALALHGHRALRPRLLNLAAVGTSIAMNVIAAGHGWRNLTIWIMPPVAYSLASDTAIGVVRAWAIARQRALNEALADEGTAPLAIVGGLLLWTLRLILAPTSTLAGFRRWVIEECPLAPGRRAAKAPTQRPGTKPNAATQCLAITDQPDARAPWLRSQAGTTRPTKTQRFLDLVIDRHGPLINFPITNVSKVSTELAPEVDLNTGAARTALRRQVLAAQNGSSS